MMAAWMLQALVAGALLAAAARGLDELFRLYRLPRRFVWAAAVAGAALLPMWSLVASRSPVPLTVAAPVAVVSDAVSPEAGSAAVTTAASSLLSWLGATSARLGDAGSAGIGVLSARAGGVLPDSWLAAAWLLLSALLLAVLAWTALRFTRTRRDWREQEIAGTRVYVTHEVGPAVVGVFRPAIIVPRWLLGADDEHQRLVVLHEREHVRTGDHALLAGAAVLAALLPWNLPLHWLLRRLRLAIELDCDRRVLAAGAEPRAYGAMLIDIASRTHRLPVAAAALADPPTDLETRILAMTTKLPRFRPLRAAAVTACAAALVLVACDIDLLDPALQNATIGEAIVMASSAEPTAAAAVLNARYFVDGVEVSLDEIRELPVAGFARVEVVQADRSPSGAAEVRLMTTAAAAADVALTATPAVPATRREVRAAETTLRSAREQELRAELTRRAVEARAQRIEATQDTSADGARRILRTLRAAEEAGVRSELTRRAADPRVQSYETTRRDVATQDSAAILRRALTLRAAEEAAVRSETPRVRHVVTSRVGDVEALRSQPLFIIDGVIISGSPVNLDRLDIESIEIVKGAAAARLYGSRAANGVIMITTRR